MNYLKISWEDFVATYKPITNPLVKDASYGGFAFETYGAEIDAVRKANDKDPNTVWTVLDSNEDEPDFEEDEDGNIIEPENYEPMPLPITSGYHYVNRLCYFITEVPCPADTQIDVIDN